MVPQFDALSLLGELFGGGQGGGQQLLMHLLHAMAQRGMAQGDGMPQGGQIPMPGQGSGMQTGPYQNPGWWSGGSGATGGGMQIGPPNLGGGSGGPPIGANGGPPQWSNVPGTPVPGGGTWYPYGVSGSTITGGNATLSAPDPNAIVGGTPDPQHPGQMIGGMTNAYMAQRALDAAIRPPGGAPWWTTNQGWSGNSNGPVNPQRTVDPNSSLPIWQQLGYYDKANWENAGKPTQSGGAFPSLTDPNTGIYHYELYTPEYERAFTAAQNANNQWRPLTYPSTPSSGQVTYAYQHPNEENPPGFGRGASRPIPWWMTGGSGVNPAGGSAGGSMPSAGPSLWQNLGFGSKADWRTANKPGMRTP